MKHLRLAAWTVWFMLSWMTLAHAGPVIGAIGAVAGWLASGTALAQLALGFLFTAVRVGIGLLFKAKQPSQKPAGVSAETKFGGDNPLSFIMGAFAGGGQLEYANSYGKVHDTPNAYLVHVISLADLPMGMTGLWIDDKHVTLPDMSGPMPDEKGYIIEEFRSPKGSHSPYVWIRYHDGSQTEADVYLRAIFGADAERPYLADMIFRGVPYIVVTSRFDTGLFNGIPQFLFETAGIPLYDPRKDSTVGGSGSHRWNDGSTWEPSNNNAVHVYNILRGIRYEGEWMWGGQCEAWQLPLANWFAAMNACNLAIGLAGGGTEPQFRNGCEITTDQEPLDVINDILKGCNGRMAEIGGVYKLSIGAPSAAVYSFTDETIVVTEEQNLDPFPSLDQTFNGAQASYPEPAEKWAAKDAPAYLRTDLEVLDDNRRLVTGIQYPYTPYAVQVQRLLQAAVNDARRFKIHTFVLPPEAMVLEPNDVVSWTSARNGYVEKKFVIVSIEADSNLLQYVTLKEIDPSDYSWNPATDQQDYSISPPIGAVIPPVQQFTGWQVFPAALTDADGAQRRPSIEVRFPGNFDDIQFVRVQVRLAADEGLMFDAVLPYGDPELNDNPVSRILNGTFLPITVYEVRGIFEPLSERDTEWSEWLPVTTPNIRITDVTAYLDGVGEDIYETLQQLRADQEDLRARMELIAVDAAEATGSNIDLHSVAKKFRNATAVALREMNASIELKTRVYRQADAPSGGELSDGDIWIDTDDANFVRVWNAAAGVWEDAGAKGLATFAADDPPTASNLGDLWVDTDDDNKLYRWNGTEWIEVSDSRIAAHASILDAVSASLGEISADGLRRIEVSAGTGDVIARLTDMVRATIANDWVEAGTIIEVGFEDGDIDKPFADYLIAASRFVIYDPNTGDKSRPLVFENGELVLDNLRVGTGRFREFVSDNEKLRIRGFDDDAYISVTT